MSTQFKVNERYMTDKYRVNCAFSRVKYIRRTFLLLCGQGHWEQN